MTIRNVTLFIFVIIITLLFGCSAKTIEQVLEDVYERAHTTFENEGVESNTESETFPFYLPRNYEIVEEAENNLLLEKDEQTFILFYNALEAPTSNLNYLAAESAGNYILLEAFEQEDRFGFVLVKEIVSDEEETYELQVGIGGVKLTTITTKNQLVEHTEEMMEIANSIYYNDTDSEVD